MKNINKHKHVQILTRTNNLKQIIYVWNIYKEQKTKTNINIYSEQKTVNKPICTKKL